MTNEQRMKKALLVIAFNMRGEGADCLRPLSAQTCNLVADLAWAAAMGEPHNDLDNALAGQ